jgi:hypothetical protein
MQTRGRVDIYDDKVALMSIDPYPVWRTCGISTRRQKRRQITFVFDVLYDAGFKTCFYTLFPGATICQHGELTGGKGYPGAICLPLGI